MALDDRCAVSTHRPGDVGIGKRPPQGGEQRRGQHNIADTAGLEQEQARRAESDRHLYTGAFCGIIKERNLRGWPAFHCDGRTPVDAPDPEIIAGGILPENRRNCLLRPGRKAV